MALLKDIKKEKQEINSALKSAIEMALDIIHNNYDDLKAITEHEIKFTYDDNKNIKLQKENVLITVINKRKNSRYTFAVNHYIDNIIAISAKMEKFNSFFEKPNEKIETFWYNNTPNEIIKEKIKIILLHYGKIIAFN